MNLSAVSSKFQVRRLNAADTESIYRLCLGNPIFYEHHPPLARKESIAEMFTALPPNKTMQDKFFCGFFQNNRLVAIMDFVVSYPDTNTVYIGLFMVDSSVQNKGVGSAMIRECTAFFKSLGYTKIRLASDQTNPQSNAFWDKIGFCVVDSRQNYLIREYFVL